MVRGSEVAPAQSERRRGLTEITRKSRFELEATGDGVVNGGAPAVPHVVRAAAVQSEGGDVEMEGSVGLDVCEGTG